MEYWRGHACPSLQCILLFTTEYYHVFVDFQAVRSKLGRKGNVPGTITVPIIAAIALSNKVPCAVLSQALLSSL